MIRKVIKSGNSLAVTIPQNVVKENNFKIGDVIDVSIETVKKTKKTTLTPAFIDWVDKYIESNRPALEELANK